LVGVTHTEAQAKALAKSVEVQDGPDQEGKMFMRKGRLYDSLPKPYENDELAAFINNGAVPPDLSHITRARFGSEDYIFNILTGYKDPPPGMVVKSGQHYLPYFPGSLIAMAKALNDGAVEWEDDTPATVAQQAKDVATFLAWVGEPELEYRRYLTLKMTAALLLTLPFSWYVKKFRWSSYGTRRLSFLDHPTINDKYWKH